MSPDSQSRALVFSPAKARWPPASNSDGEAVLNECESHWRLKLVKYPLRWRLLCVGVPSDCPLCRFFALPFQYQPPTSFHLQFSLDQILHSEKFLIPANSMLISLHHFVPGFSSPRPLFATPAELSLRNTRRVLLTPPQSFLLA